MASDSNSCPRHLGCDRVTGGRALAVPAAVLGSIGDPEGTRTVGSIVVLLVALGLALVMLAVWLRRITRPDLELLAPLELMGQRKWRRADPVWQRRRLDEVRPAGAVPLQPSVAPPELDVAFDAGPTATGFDDLHADRLPGTGRSAPLVSPAFTPIGLERPDELPDGEVDPAALAAAEAELDAELGPRLDAPRDADAGLGPDRR